MNNKYNTLKNVMVILYVISAVILACVAITALVGLFTDFSHMMNACVAPDDISDELIEMFMMLLMCVFFGSSASIGILNYKSND